MASFPASSANVIGVTSPCGQIIQLLKSVNFGSWVTAYRIRDRGICATLQQELYMGLEPLADSYVQRCRTLLRTSGVRTGEIGTNRRAYFGVFNDRTSSW